MLELENELQKERQKLGSFGEKALRAGWGREGWEEGEAGRGLQPMGLLGGCDEAFPLQES